MLLIFGFRQRETLPGGPERSAGAPWTSQCGGTVDLVGNFGVTSGSAWSKNTLMGDGASTDFMKSGSYPRSQVQAPSEAVLHPADYGFRWRSARR